MERKLNAELWDKMHYLFRDFNDRMVHVELHYDFEIDIDALKTVLICFLKKRLFFTLNLWIITSARIGRLCRIILMMCFP